MKNEKQPVSLDEVIRAQKSIRGRQDRMRKMSIGRRSWQNENSVKSPIEAIGVFDAEISEMEKALEKMQNRIDNVTILI